MSEYFIYEPLARKLYTAYCSAANWRSLVTREKLPDWENVNPRIQECWRAVAKVADTEAALSEVMLKQYTCTPEDDRKFIEMLGWLVRDKEITLAKAERLSAPLRFPVYVVID